MTVNNLSKEKLNHWHWCENCQCEHEVDQLVKISLSTKKTSFILCKKCVNKMHERAMGEL